MENKQDKVSILIVDDDYEHRAFNEHEVKRLFSELTSSNLTVKTADSAESMFAILKDQSFHVVLLDWDLGEDPVTGERIDGIKKIPQILELQPSTRVLVVTSIDDTALAIEAMKLGAIGYVTKCASESKTREREKQIKEALKSSKFELEMLIRSYSVSSSYPEVISQSKAMRELDKKLKVLAEINMPVLLRGAPGLGKTYTAKRLHEFSKSFFKDDKRPFANIDINAFNENLLESELFGHEKGSFTGAISRRQGVFEVISNGTILLDEIGDASLNVQSKLLKVLGERSFRRVGGNVDLKTNARIVMATNQNLEKLMSEGKFREDLYSRISTIEVFIPTLEQRKDDIPYICQDISNKLRKKYGKNLSYNDFPEELKTFIQNHHFTYNIRDIEKLLSQLISFCHEKNSGKLDYKLWKNVLRTGVESNTNMDLDTFALIEQLSNRVGLSDWPGIKEIKKRIYNRSLAAAQEKFPNQKKAAEALGVSTGYISQNLNKEKKQKVNL